jgi:hypothetical protein
MKELEAMTPEELADALQSPPIRAVYEMYKGKLKGEPLRQSIDAKDLSINQGILSVIRALMQQGGANKLKNCTTMDLPEYLNDENYKRLMEELARKEEDNPEVKGRELERNMYLKAHQRDIVCFLNNCCQCGTMEFVNRGKKWKPSYQLIKDGEKVEYQCQGMATMDFQGEFDKAYYEFCTEIKKEQNGLEDIVSNFLGRTITDYVFASKKK